MSHFGIVGMTGVAVGMNTIYQIRHDRDPFPVMLTGGLLMGAFVLIGSGYPELGSAFAAVYLLSVALQRGDATLSLITGLAGTK